MSSTPPPSTNTGYSKTYKTLYLLCKPVMRFNIFDFFGIVLRVIWAHHHLVIFKGIPFKPEVIISNELVKLSNMNSIVV
ncbi:hypothetical protein HMPREF1544_10507 [Mucor circinelloides 1006PhL]|uniref:Uncharacterized protein n=1 Tax=Mucor circinelloides f. circinelloides (strain 1006PhL) TaxID=1220926 RepID=S2JSF1_MUCC1|nr:hypothetical protein HMPREF1544_10507 [Mucor circinelloides 1006PhL]